MAFSGAWFILIINAFQQRNFCQCHTALTIAISSFWLVSKFFSPPVIVRLYNRDSSRVLRLTLWFSLHLTSFSRELMCSLFPQVTSQVTHREYFFWSCLFSFPSNWMLFGDDEDNRDVCDMFHIFAGQYLAWLTVFENHTTSCCYKSFPSYLIEALWISSDSI